MRLVRGQPGDHPNRNPGSAPNLLGGDIDRAHADYDQTDAARQREQRTGARLRRCPECLGETAHVGAQSLGRRLGQILGQAHQQIAVLGLGEADHQHPGV